MINTNENTVLIIGKAASGKSTLASKLYKEHPEFLLFRSDDYIHHGYEQSLYALMDDITKNKGKKMIIEGVQGYRLLRKGVELGTFTPDVIFITEASFQERCARYMNRGESDKIKKLPGFDKNLDTVYREYLQNRTTEPRTVEIETEL